MKPLSKASISLLIESVRIVYNSSPKWTWVNALVMIIRGVVPLLLLYIVKQLIDVVTAYSSGINTNEEVLFTTIGLTTSFFLLNSISGSISNLTRERHSHFINDFVQNIIHNKTVHIPYFYFEDANYQDTFYRALNDSSYRPARIFYSLLLTLQNIITLTLIIIVLSNIHWAMIPLLILSSGPVFYYRILYTKKIYQYRKDHTQDERRVHYFNRLLTAKDFAKELRVFNLGKTFKSEYEHYKQDLRNKQWSLSKAKTIREIIVQLLSTIILLVIISYVIKQTINGVVSTGSMAMYFLALQRAYAVLQGLMGGLSSLYEDNLFIKNFFDFQNIKIKDKKGNLSFPSPIKQGIEFKNVSFQYPNSSKWALTNINLSISKGQTVAVVGHNGCGKTSLVKLLSGLHQPNKGEILIDNQNLNDISLDEIADNLSIIFQDFMLYNTSAKNNIRYGNIHRTNNDRDIKEAAHKAGIGPMLEKMPQGYETTLGTLFKGSQMLSRGEWQRTALARSFYNTNAQLIILDEPTSSLDAFTEAKLINHFKVITKDKTSLIVSHRLSTIKLADILVVMENGSIAEVGTADELIQKKGVYFKMIESLK
ncbi:ABC transporter ATP-binding protein [Carboxylicivirga sp. M1479]|uniref:ABC transporter ATP-binding protein n=1 Tax=Carboxylicivirga sp. M1479 TaxID=2594476 RepID=UPI001178A69D|nr:ABC transporter ATP-binding protein [Carboxylicivirga sp. M1479]TRX63009.1 ABC transporter ATP-binding protein [Carboxylicivirga sp. M1479]